MKKEAKMMTFFYAWTWGGLRNAHRDRKQVHQRCIGYALMKYADAWSSQQAFSTTWL